LGIEIPLILPLSPKGERGKDEGAGNKQE